MSTFTIIQEMRVTTMYNNAIRDTVIHALKNNKFARRYYNYVIAVLRISPAGVSYSGNRYHQCLD